MNNVADKLYNILGTKFNNTDIKTLDSSGKETTDMEEIEMFSLNNYTKISGDLIITNQENEDHITRLQGLNCLSDIEGELSIVNNPYLKNLLGLNNLTTINRFIIHGNENLISINGMENIISIYSLIIDENTTNIFYNLKNIKHIQKIFEYVFLQFYFSTLNFQFTFNFSFFY